MPTCNRHITIQHWLYSAAWQMRWHGIDIIIYDSSDNLKTEAVVYNYQVDGCDNVIYKRYEGEFDGFSLDQKIIDAYMEYQDQYEYIWMCRDGIIISINQCIEDLSELMQQSYDCLVVDAQFRNDNEKSQKEYTELADCADLLRDQGTRMATLGTLIFSSKLIKRIIKEEPVDEKTYSLWQMVAPLHSFAKQPFKICGYIGEVFFYNVAGTLNSFWNSAGKAMEQWSYRWDKVVSSLPAEYESAKPDIIKIDMYDFHPFYIMSLLRMRGNGGLSVAMVRKYKPHLKNVSNTSIFKFYLVALTPKWLSRFFVNHEHGKLVVGLKKIYKCVRMAFRGNER